MTRQERERATLAALRETDRLLRECVSELERQEASDETLDMFRYLSGEITLADATRAA